MNHLMTRALVASTLLFGTPLTFANDAEPSKSRAQVVQALSAAQAQGGIDRTEAGAPIQAFNHANEKSRAEVVRELQAAKQAGEMSYGEADYPPAFTHRSNKSRAEVTAELKAASQAGELDHTEAGRAG